MTTSSVDETARAERLLEAQSMARRLFDSIEESGLIRAGISERQASDEVRDLAAEALGVTRHWHKRVIRAGANSLLPYHANPPDRVIEPDDIVYADLGPIFAEWEADFGRTYVLGSDPEKLRLQATLPILFGAGKAFFEATAAITGEQMFDFMVGEADRHGWAWGGTIAGHLVGEFPHDLAEGDDDYSRITAGNNRAMRGVDRTGKVCHWILEVHIVDRDREIGGFYEELLDL
ncbi:MAG TPA: M24 family metallopeptidase [Mycobacteriales bacterium]|nr:M24 family metallopeptidase [Mycobacteriales bacterium]